MSGLGYLRPHGVIAEVVTMGFDRKPLWVSASKSLHITLA